MMDFRTPVILDGRYIRLVPLVESHIDALAAAGESPEIWRWMSYGYSGTKQAMAVLVHLLLERQSDGTDLPFSIFLRSSNRPVGMTRYLGIDRPSRNVEVGGTWISPELWRTPVNSESKLLMLSNAFEAEGCERVQLKTDIRNLRSQRAIERLGALREGVLRHHMALADGTYRDSVVYSILRSEWPVAERRLRSSLDRPWARPAEA
jgi:N-acetyltransferase